MQEKTQELGTSVLQIFRDKHIKDTKQRKLLQHELTELLHRWYTVFFELTESAPRPDSVARH